MLGQASPACARRSCQTLGPTTSVLMLNAAEAAEGVRLNAEAQEMVATIERAFVAIGDNDQARNFWRQALEAKPELAAGYFEQ